jgi:hypothetical protein
VPSQMWVKYVHSVAKIGNTKTQKTVTNWFISAPF